MRCKPGDHLRKQDSQQREKQRKGYKKSMLVCLKKRKAGINCVKNSGSLVGRGEGFGFYSEMGPLEG